MRRLQQVLAIVGGFLMPLGLVVIAIGWYGTAHTGYVFEQIPYLVSGGLFGLGLTFVGALVFFSAWLVRIIELLERLSAPAKAVKLPDTLVTPIVQESGHR